MLALVLLLALALVLVALALALVVLVVHPYSRSILLCSYVHVVPLTY